MSLRNSRTEEKSRGPEITDATSVYDCVGCADACWVQNGAELRSPGNCDWRVLETLPGYVGVDSQSAVVGAAERSGLAAIDSHGVERESGCARRCGGRARIPCTGDHLSIRSGAFAGVWSHRFVLQNSNERRSDPYSGQCAGSDPRAGGRVAEAFRGIGTRDVEMGTRSLGKDSPFH